ncbi:M20 family metallopeptidase [Chitinophagales bacterium]|nr:M20 family metallopeptidase [Chitinophagales bacterium]
MDLLTSIKAFAKDLHPRLVEWRRHLHAHPELSFEEFNTSELICAILDEYGITYTPRVAKTGIIALIKGKNPNSKCIALRGDMDALPIDEKNQLDYASTKPGVMHACGHDFHTSNILGAAIILEKFKHAFEGTVKVIFQPSEEKIPSGAPAMIAAGVLENPKVDAIIGYHVSPELSTGSFGFRAGQLMASADEIYLTIKGKGGHAAFPDQLIDPVLTTAQLLLNLQQVVSRRKSPFEPAVLSFGKLEAKGATNIIPNEVQVAGTLRAMNEDFRFKAHEWIKQICEETAAANGASCEVNIVVGYPFVKNDEDLTQRMINEAETFGSEIAIHEIPARMGAEDFAYYSQEVPACFIRVGTGNSEKGTTHGLHTNQFNVDDDALLHSSALMAWMAINA